MAAKSLGAGAYIRRALAAASPCLIPLLFLFAVAGSVKPEENSPSERMQENTYTIRINADMVVLHATVRNRKGTPVSGLNKGNFQVYEDGVRQQITYFMHKDIPVTVGLVVDNSGSMAPKRPEVIAAATAFARSSNSQDQMFVVGFNEHVWFGLPDSVLFTDQPAQLEAALSRIDANGETALYDAVAVAIERLKKGNRDKKVLIVISDGADNASKHNLAEVMAMAQRSDAVIYTVGIYDEDDPDHNPGALKRLAKASGGEYFTAESLRDVVPICERIAQDIRSQYTIAYVPANRKQDGSYRAIQVKAEAPGRGRLFVRTRAGYYAPVQSQIIAGSQSGQP